jgi:hypothetical protein
VRQPHGEDIEWFSTKCQLRELALKPLPILDLRILGVYLLLPPNLK